MSNNSIYSLAFDAVTIEIDNFVNDVSKLS